MLPWKRMIDAGTLVRVKVNSALRVDRSAKLESALKQLGCTFRIERMSTEAITASDNGRETTMTRWLRRTQKKTLSAGASR